LHRQRGPEAQGLPEARRPTMAVIRGKTCPSGGWAYDRSLMGVRGGWGFVLVIVLAIYAGESLNGNGLFTEMASFPVDS
jgi:hypothetical protein